MSDSTIRQLERDSIHGDKLDLIKYLTALERIGQLTRDQKITLYLLNHVENNSLLKARLLKSARLGWPIAIKIANLLSFNIPKPEQFEIHHIRSLPDSDAINLVCDYIEKVMYLFEWQLGSEDAPKNAIKIARDWAVNPSWQNSMVADITSEESMNVGRNIDDMQAKSVALAAGFIALSISSFSGSKTLYDSAYLASAVRMAMQASENPLLEMQYQMERFCEYLTGTNNIAPVLS